MKKDLHTMTRRFLSYLTLAGIVMTASCNRQEILPELTFDTTEITVPGTGAEVSITYNLTNPVDGAEWNYSCEQDWISGYDFSTDGKIVMNVAANYVEEAREAKVTFTYSAIDKEYVVTVKQEAGSPQLPNVIFESDVFEIPAEGGSFTVGYTVENPVAGAKLSGKSDAEWLTNLDTSVDGEVSFNVSLSYVEEERITDIRFEYADMEFVLPVVQAVGDPDDAFYTEILESTELTGSIRIVPADSIMTYALFNVQTDHLATYDYVEDFIDEQVEAYRMIASIAGVTLEEFMLTVLAARAGNWTVNYLFPSTDYSFVVVGMKQDGTQTTIPFVENYRTKDPDMKDMTFVIEPTPGEKSAVLKITPSDDNINYYADVKLLSDMPSGENLNISELQDWVHTLIWRGGVLGKTPEEVIAEVVLKGETEKTFENLTSDTDYVAFAAAISPEGVVLSDCEAVEFRTLELSESDITFDIDVTPGVASVTLDIVPSNSDKYTAVVVKMSECEGRTDEEIAEEQAMQPHVLFNIKTGPATITLNMINLIEKMVSDTEYKVLVFGTDELKVTSEVMSFDIKTLPQDDINTFEAEMEISEITSCGARLDITVNHKSNLYLAGFVPAEFTDEQTKERIDIYAERLISKQVVPDKPGFMGYAGYQGDINDGREMYIINEMGYIMTLDAGVKYKPYVVPIDDLTAEYGDIFFGEIFQTESGLNGARIIPDELLWNTVGTSIKEESCAPTPFPQDSYLLGKFPYRK